MKANNLLVKDRKKLKAKRTPNRSKPRASKPNEIWGIDMTKVKTLSGWAYMVMIIDWNTKKIETYFRTKCRAVNKLWIDFTQCIE